MGSLSMTENCSETEEKGSEHGENSWSEITVEKGDDNTGENGSEITAEKGADNTGENWECAEKGDEAAEEDDDTGENWSGIVERTISAPVRKVWDIASNFWEFPNLLTIEPVEGESGVAGCIRKVSNLPGRTDTEECQWATQKLAAINTEQHVFSYEFVESNTGLQPGYYSTFQAKEVDQEKTSVRWAFRFGPTQEGAEHLVPFIMSGTDMYIQELEKLANNSHELEEEEVVAA
ncbi:unnamed protein product [Sphagnum troendelagicum]|uniref:Uncharacterized protein n=1 Tax=Sphagnum troendelagicum TaxID=128251 RepID=A0ABP0TBI3_9BRYO